jgi:hypothetical protein
MEMGYTAEDAAALEGTFKRSRAGVLVYPMNASSQLRTCLRIK